MGWVYAETHYGYSGYVYTKEIKEIDLLELLNRQDKDRFLRVGRRTIDLRTQPKVQGLPLEYLPQNAIVERMDGEYPQGWSRIRTASGKEGYVPACCLERRMDGDDYFLETKCHGAYFRQRFYKQHLNECVFREQVVWSALAYLNTQYRWGGKSADGIDCSGLVFMSYLENGVVIYRDARLHENYPVQPISKERLKRGDLIYFPGHVAMYLGAGRYIHATGHIRQACVTINSLRCGDPLYRADLAQNIIACGSIFRPSMTNT